MQAPAGMHQKDRLRLPGGAHNLRGLNQSMNSLISEAAILVFGFLHNAPADILREEM
jgi:hypothetical protein